MKILLTLVFVVAVVLGAGAAGFLAFGDSDDSDDNGNTAVETPAGSGTGGLSAAEVLEQAAEATETITSFHFVLTHENGSTPLPLNLALETAEGDISVPDQMQAEANANALGVNVSVDVIGIGDRTWVTNPFNRRWQELGNTNIRDFADPSALVRGVLPSIMNPQLDEGGSVDGVDTHKVNGTMDSGVLQDALGIAESGHQVAVEAWIGKDDLLPRRVRLAGPLSDAEDSDVVREVQLSRYNEPVEIMPPE